MASLYVDSAGRVMGYNPNGMAGNSGWVQITEEAITQVTGMEPGAFGNSLMDEQSAARWKLVEGVLVARSAAEMSADHTPATETPSQTEKLEAQVMYTALLTDTLLESEE